MCEKIYKSIYKIEKKQEKNFIRSWLAIFNDTWSYNYLSLVSGWEQIENGFVYGSLDSFYKPQVKTLFFFFLFLENRERVVKSIEKFQCWRTVVYALGVNFHHFKTDLANNLWKNFQTKKQIVCWIEIFETRANFLKWNYSIYSIGNQYLYSLDVQQCFSFLFFYYFQ